MDAFINKTKRQRPPVAPEQELPFTSVYAKYRSSEILPNENSHD